MSVFDKTIYIVLIIFDYVIHAICIYSIIKLKAFKNCFGYICFIISITECFLILISAFYIFYDADIEPKSKISIFRRLTGVMQMYLWTALAIGHLYQCLNRMVAVIWSTFYYLKFNTKVSLVCATSIWFLSIFFILPYIDDRCQYYYDPLNKKWEYLDTAFMRIIIKKSKKVVKTDHTIKNNSQITKNHISTKEKMFAFQCFFLTLSLLINSMVYMVLFNIKGFQFDLNFAINIFPLIWRTCVPMTFNENLVLGLFTSIIENSSDDCTGQPCNLGEQTVLQR
uniref:7TM_GPCR_Srx domain-containing protein n=1 Tax=Rhabditophanes sp. KR3021 TaxID=114890 RepID=A0AC35U2K6_9BILA